MPSPPLTPTEEVKPIEGTFNVNLAAFPRETAGFFPFGASKNGTLEEKERVYIYIYILISFGPLEFLT